MKKIILLLSILAFTACEDELSEIEPLANSLDIENISGDFIAGINGDTTFLFQALNTNFPFTNHITDQINGIGMIRTDSAVGGNQFRIFLSHVDLDTITYPYTFVDLRGQQDAFFPNAELQWTTSDNGADPLYIGAVLERGVNVVLTSFENEVLTGSFSGSLFFRDENNMFIDTDILHIESGAFRISLVRE